MTQTHPTRALGDLDVSAIGMGAMPMTATFAVDPERAERAVHAAIDAGITLFDTADSYSPTSEHGVNECALARAVKTYPGNTDDLIVATKGGLVRGEQGSWGSDGRPEHLATAARDSLQRLGLEAHPLYQLHRPDPKVPYAESCGAIAQMIDEGLVVRAGVSNVDAAELEIARDVLGESLVSVQNQYSPVTRENEAILELCQRYGLAFLAWGPLGGRMGAKGLGDAAPEFAQVARERNVSPQQVAIAWLLHRSEMIIPIPGATRPQSILDSAAARGLRLTEEEQCRLDAAALPPTAGSEQSLPHLGEPLEQE